MSTHEFPGLSNCPPLFLGAVQAAEPPRLTPKGKAASLKPKRGRCPVHLGACIPPLILV